MHCKPDGTPFYVGKGCDTPKGRRSHIFKHRNPHYQRVVAKYGWVNVLVYVFPCVFEAQALADEIQHIAQLRREGHVLCNLTDGGEGTSGRKLSEETKEKIRSAQAGKVRAPQTPEANVKRSAALKGRSKPPRTAEHSKHLGEANRGRRRVARTAKHCEALSIAITRFYAAQR